MTVQVKVEKSSQGQGSSIYGQAQAKPLDQHRASPEAAPYRPGYLEALDSKISRTLLHIRPGVIRWKLPRWQSRSPTSVLSITPADGVLSAPAQHDRWQELTARSRPNTCLHTAEPTNSPSWRMQISLSSGGCVGELHTRFISRRLHVPAHIHCGTGEDFTCRRWPTAV